MPKTYVGQKYGRDLNINSEKKNKHKKIQMCKNKKQIKHYAF